nr:hypothetical protein [uncultured Oscillibacter sp.]
MEQAYGTVVISGQEAPALPSAKDAFTASSGKSCFADLSMRRREAAALAGAPPLHPATFEKVDETFIFFYRR